MPLQTTRACVCFFLKSSMHSRQPTEGRFSSGVAQGCIWVECTLVHSGGNRRTCVPNWSYQLAREAPTLWLGVRSKYLWNRSWSYAGTCRKNLRKKGKARSRNFLQHDSFTTLNSLSTLAGYLVGGLGWQRCVWVSPSSSRSCCNVLP